MKKYFHEDEPEFCHELDFHLDKITKENPILKLTEAKRDVGSSMFFCSYDYEVGDKGYCGKECKAYSPRNGRSGICLYNRPVYDAGDEVEVQIIKGKVAINKLKKG